MKITLEVVERIVKISLPIIGTSLIIFGALKEYAPTLTVGFIAWLPYILGLLEKSLDIVKIVIENTYSKIGRKSFLLEKQKNIIQH
jgi:hypothetical protein